MQKNPKKSDLPLYPKLVGEVSSLFRMKLASHLWIPFLFLTFIFFQKHRVSSQCLDHEKRALLELRNNFSDYSPSSGIATWSPDTDCCQWRGIVCNNVTNKVVSLDIGNSDITGDGISSTIFTLEDLERLNLANNYFNSNIPYGLDRFSKLTHLNLSNSGFTGQIPMEISRLTRLVSLDLTFIKLDDDYFYNDFFETKLENLNLSTLVRNLTNLKQLHLGSVNISSEVPISLNKLSSLEYLTLRWCNLLGDFSEQIFFLKNLIQLDISKNPYLKVVLRELPKNGVLESLILSRTNLSWVSVASLSNLNSLKRLEVSHCGISGPLPYWISEFRQLVHLDLSFNNLVGDIHSLQNLTELVYLDLSQNSFTSGLHHIKNLSRLSYLNMGFNNFTDDSSTFMRELENLTNLTHLDLSSNKFTGEISFVKNLRKLNYLSLSNNSFTGWIPKMKNHPELLVIRMDRNNLSGPMPLLSSSKNVSSIILSYNSLDGRIPLSYGNLSKLERLVADNNLIEGPIPSSLFEHRFLRRFSLRNNKLGIITTDEHINITSSILSDVILSNNTLRGKFPNWIWNIGLSIIDLSDNLLEGLVLLPPDISSHHFFVVDLSNNKLSGSIPAFTYTYILDLSNNRFSSEISKIFAANRNYTRFLSIANNTIFGELPKSICDAESLSLLDLSHNKLNGSIPQCIGKRMRSLVTLILEDNEFIGKIPQDYGENCQLNSLSLQKNQLKGNIPKSLKNCKHLIYLNLGMNQFSDSFPFWLNSLTNLKVIILHSNRFYGGLDLPNINCSFPSLQILDISSNNFTGSLSLKCFRSWKTYSIRHWLGGGSSWESSDEFFSFSGSSFNYSVKLTVKGTTRDYPNSMFYSIDLSDNRFEGEIPEDFGDLKFLKSLNISRNLLSGPIPPSLGNLKDLESLDLSENKLSGSIPSQLTFLSYLSVLNLSMNKLVGKIPEGKQFSTFKDSFLGNPELCGFPLVKICSENPPISMNQDKAPSNFFTKDIQMTFLLSYVSGMIAGIIVGNTMLNKKLFRLVPS